MMKNSIKRTITAAFVALGMFLGLTATPALAVPSCSYGYMCFFDTTGGSGRLDDKLVTDWRRSVCYALPSNLYATSYIVNNSPSQFIVYKNTSCSGTYSIIYPNSYGSMNAEWNNAIRSIYRV